MTLREVCALHGALSGEETARLERLEEDLPLTAELCAADVFIDLFDPDGMKKEKKESAVLDPLDGWGTRSAATTWQTGSSNRRTSDPVLYDRPLYGTRRDMYRKPSEMVLV